MGEDGVCGGGVGGDVGAGEEEDKDFGRGVDGWVLGV